MHSSLAQQQVHDPTAPDMLSRFAAVVNDFGVVAACVLQRIGEDGHALPAAVLVDAACDGSTVPPFHQSQASSMATGRKGLPKMSRSTPDWAASSLRLKTSSVDGSSR